jgi:hypothetical protein
MPDGNGDRSEDLRASDADRDCALGRLQDAVASGMIDLDELDDRSERALQARTKGELATITSDLPVSDAPPPAIPQSDVVVLRGTSSSLERGGRWQVPRKLVLRSQKGSTKLDFTEALINHPVVEMELDVDGGSVEIRLPEGASASTDGIEATRSSVEDHRKDPPPNGRPHFVITGTIRRGSLELRGPRPRLFGRG